MSVCVRVGFVRVSNLTFAGNYDDFGIPLLLRGGEYAGWRTWFNEALFMSFDRGTKDSEMSRTYIN